MVRRTRKGGRRKKHRRGGNVVGGLLGAIKKALPSYLLYQAVKMQQKKKRVERKPAKEDANVDVVDAKAAKEELAVVAVKYKL